MIAGTYELEVSVELTDVRTSVCWTRLCSINDTFEDVILADQTLSLYSERGLTNPLKVAITSGEKRPSYAAAMLMAF